MRLRLVAVSAIALLAACSKAPSSDQTAAAAASDQAGVSDLQAQAMNPSVAAPAPPAAGPDFVAKAAASDMYEIAAAKIALKRSGNPDVKAFANMMIKDHTQSTAMIKKAVAASGQADSLKPPAALPDDKKALLDALTNASDNDFDKVYMQQQLDAHQQALDLMTAYAKGGDTPTLKDAAGKIVPVVQMHLDKVKMIQTQLAR